MSQKLANWLLILIAGGLVTYASTQHKNIQSIPVLKEQVDEYYNQYVELNTWAFKLKMKLHDDTVRMESIKNLKH